MRNPILLKYYRLVIYILWWILPGGIHSFVLSEAYHFQSSFVLVDTIVSFSILAGLCMSLWYMVRYTMLGQVEQRQTILNLLLSIAIVFLIWIGLTYFVMTLLFDNYLIAIQQTLIWRALIYLPILLLIISVYYLFGYQRIVKEHELNESRMQTLIRESELNALKSQINPHFLFNSLNSASSLAMTNPLKSREMIVMLSDFFRGSLVMGKRQFSTFDDELNHSLLYLDIEKARFGEKINVEVEVDAQDLQVEIPSLILQPLIENAVKHGVYESSVPIFIRIKAQSDEEFLSIRIENNFDSLAGSAKRGTGTGLKNVESRIRLAYGGEGSFSIQKDKDKYLVFIKLPKERDNI